MQIRPRSYMSTKGSRSGRLRRNNAALGIAALILLVIVGFSYREWMHYSQANADAAATREILDSVDRLLSSMIDAETGQRGFVLTGESRYLEPYNQAIQAIPVEFANLQRLLAPRQNESGNVTRLNNLVDQKLAELRQTIALRQTRGIAPALDVVLSDQGKRTMDEIRSICSDIQRRQSSAQN